MNTVEGIKQKISDDVTQLQIGLEEVLQRIFDQAGGKIELEKQEEVQKKFEGTKQLLERFKSQYA